MMQLEMSVIEVRDSCHVVQNFLVRISELFQKLFFFFFFQKNTKNSFSNYCLKKNTKY